MLHHNGVKHIVFSSTAATYGEPQQRADRRGSPAAARSTPTACTKLVIEGIAPLATTPPTACASRPALLQRRGRRPTGDRRETTIRKRTSSRSCCTSPMGAGPHADHLRRRLPDARRHLHARLHPRRRPARAHVRGARPPARRRPVRAVQSGHGNRPLRHGCREDGARDHRAPIPIKVGPRRTGDPPRLVAELGRAVRVLGWRPEIPSLADIVGSAWSWRLMNPLGYAH